MYHSNRIIPENYWKKYNNFTTRTVKHNCGIILKKQSNHFFVVQTYNNYYGFPKGSVKDNYEQFRDCAVREFYEETGYLLDLSEFETEQLVIKNDRTKVTYVFFVVHVPETFDIPTRPVDDVEITSYGWAHGKKIRNLRCSEITGRAICRLLKA